MKLFFILGSNPALSIAELASLFPLSGSCQYNFLPPNIFLLHLDKAEEFGADKLIKNLGGIIKIGLIKSESNPQDGEEILKKVLDLMPTQFKAKYKFGFSNYSQQPIDLKFLGMKLKQILTQREIKSRWVTSRQKVLSSVVVEQNQLLKNGVEIVFLNEKGKLLIGKTLAIQPFKELSFRDYGRPARDDFSGMLPPKLAQIMINLANPRPFSLTSKDKFFKRIILDPFCGSGTILTEAMLMGFVNLIGSDISKQALANTKKNFEWLRKNYHQCLEVKINLFNKSVLNLSKFLSENLVDAIITEPYLGPPRNRKNIKQIKKKLKFLYNKSLQEMTRVLKPKGRIVMIWPVFLKKEETKEIKQNINFKQALTDALYLNLNIRDLKIINPIPEKLQTNQFINLTTRHTIIYGRPEQKIWREIVVMEK